ncbi:TonB family protein [Hymenobacter psychrotolerans]|uniref:TonB family C-terminal domain-containing protein n=1 Tax=Hymenobacter psychrotolerans DSM 18569 TaxID=1121959 RepID=A0A1M7GX55_9BACT|nr:TonB family protein [Hymenobacter psychrotolerans]SHM20992.1 TonB family C-terminal domain-containing protein [Hymenobacter psychrotolerans DSM 18569]
MLTYFRPLLLSGLLLVAGHAIQAQTQPAIENKVFSYVEKMPEFPGGQQALFRTLSQTVVYPPEAVAKRVEGRVLVNFVVASTGQVQQVKLARGIDPLLDAEALRAVAALPAFVPGKQAGKAVAVAYTLPITFKLPAEAPPAPSPAGARPATEAHAPHPVGGQDALEAYLRTAAFPEAARQARFSGLVFVAVKVDSLGVLTSAKAQPGPMTKEQLKRVKPELLSAAENLISKGPAWAPARKQGQPRRGSHLVPLVFDATAGTISVYPRVRLFPDEPPTIEGGPQALSNFIGRNVKYPPAALRSRTSGTVKIFFEVSEQGLAENPLVLNSVSPELDAEALRAVGLLPQMFPALEKGQPVRSFFVVPVTYRMR